MEELLQELVEEILLRIPPDEPAYRIRASLVCKSWFRILSDGSFLGRYRVFHRAPPLLGYLHNLYSRPGRTPRFVKTTTTASPISGEPLLGSSSCWWSLDCRHGRVLIRTYEPDDRLVVWDPVSGDQQHLMAAPIYPNEYFYTGAILCAAMDGSCDHLNCHGGPFIVVYVVATGDYEIKASVYLSETQVWGAATSINSHRLRIDGRNILLGGILYFTLGGGESILIYELSRHRLSVIDTPAGVFDNDDDMVMAKAEDGGLGLITVSLDNCVCFWRMQAGGSNDDSPGTRWAQHKVIKINTLRPQRYRRCNPCMRHVIGFAEDNDIIFINRDEGVFMIDLKSMHVRKIGERQTGKATYDTILPYVSFYTPGTSSFMPPFSLT